jgi:tetratricopeptide (TPR) repeat protein
MKFILSSLTILLFCTFGFGQSEREKGIDLYKNGDYISAIEVLQNVVKTDDKDRDAWLFLGMSFVKTKKNKEALKALRKGDSISSVNSSEYSKELKIISKPRPRYTELAKQNNTAGRVKLAIEFGADGYIKAIVPIQTLPDGLTTNCLEAAQKIEFEPAYKNDKPVNYIRIIEYTFDIY